MKTDTIALIFILSNVLAFSKNYLLDSTTLNSRVVAEGLDIPWELHWGPDNHIWMTERFGRVSRLHPKSGERITILEIPEDSIFVDGEAGLLGLTLHPDFDNSPYVYLVYTYSITTEFGDISKEKLVRYKYDGSQLVNPSILIDGIPANFKHVGSRLIILDDNTMLMSTGDANSSIAPQDLNSLAGKILRLNLDGTIPEDNPIPGSYVYSWGHRNAQGLLQAFNGNIYVSEHGETSDDELQILQKARNYGWPQVEGDCDLAHELVFCNDSNVVEPIQSWTPTIAPSDIIWYNHPAIPEFNNKLLLTTLKDKKLISLKFNPTGDQVIQEESYLAEELGRLRDICISPEGAIYLATNGVSWSNNSPFTHKIIELKNESYVPTLSVARNSSAKVRFWPNQMNQSEKFNFQIDLPYQVSLVIYDSMGRHVYAKRLKGSGVIDPQLSRGVYTWIAYSNLSVIEQGRIQVR